ncbi:cytochrome-c peroxidase [Lewinella cohaerens]|uniref:cytochrome-c peroxidase n=1 Tax=Lewinella cohaerens TaxID=70995 RepID=UPI0003A87BB1|nr:cytochrome c peroxidase [Lewinella cohaerens]
MLKRSLPLLGLSIFLLAACANEKTADPLDVTLQRTMRRLSPDQSLDYYKVPHHEDLENIPAGIGNTLTHEKVILGKMLFFETALGIDAVNESGMQTYSCSTCHVPEAGFTPGASQGIADGAEGFGINGEGRGMRDDYTEDQIDAQGARPLSMVGVAYVQNSMWAGRFGARFNNEGTEHLWGVTDPTTEVNHTGLDGLEAQNIEGTHTHRMRVDDYILDELGYREMFDAAFYDWPENARYGREALSFALSAYIRTLMPYEAPYQEWLRGDEDAMDEQMKRGALLFFSDAGCYRCHNGPVLNGNIFQAIGVNDLCDVGGLATGEDDERNLGRGGFTLRDEDMYAFKVPQLYNLKKAGFYFHGSSHTSLRSVVEYFNNGVPENPRVDPSYISPFFHPLNLSEKEVEDLTHFITHGLYDPNLSRYAPEEVLSGNCFPNNDELSQQDLGCN